VSSETQFKRENNRLGGRREKGDDYNTMLGPPIDLCFHKKGAFNTAIELGRKKMRKRSASGVRWEGYIEKEDTTLPTSPSF